MKKVINEFKEFINRGNVVDMAIGVMIGAAFKAIIDSLVANIISPIVGLIFRQDFNHITVDVFGVSFGVGAFIMAVLNFFIIAVILFVIIKLMAMFHCKKEEPVEEEVTTKICPYCKSEIALEATRCPHCTSEV